MTSLSIRLRVISVQDAPPTGTQGRIQKTVINRDTLVVSLRRRGRRDAESVEREGLGGRDLLEPGDAT